VRATIISRRYAEALADLAEESGALRRVRGELRTLARAFEDSAELRTFAVAGRKSRAEKQALLRGISAELGLSDLSARLLDLLIHKKRMSILAHVADGFAEEVDRRLGIVEARVTSAAPLSEEQRMGIVKKLESITGQHVRLDEQVSESLIAGFQVRMGDLFYDGSLRGRLKQARERMAYGG